MATSATWTSIFPASTFERSRMSLIRPSRSAPAWWIVEANSICFSLRFPSVLSASSFARMSSELSGVRSSWLMLARNSLLYFDESASCSARSCSAGSRQLDLAVLDLDAVVLLLELLRLLLELFVRLLQLLLLRLQQLLGRLERLRLLLELDVRALQLLLLGLQLLRALLELEREGLRLAEQLLRAHRRLDRVDDDADRLAELVEEAALHLAERLERRELDHRHHLVLEEHRHDDDVLRRRLAEAGGDLHVVLRRLADQDRLPLERRLADERLAELVAVRDLLARLVAVARDQLERRLLPPEPDLRSCRLRRLAGAPARGRTRRSRRRRAASAPT